MLVKIGDCFVDPEQIQAVRDMFVPALDETPTVEIILANGECFEAQATMDEAEAALIDAGMIEDPYPEEDALALGEEERVELEELYEHGYEYLARDADGKLNAFYLGLYAANKLKLPRGGNDSFNVIVAPGDTSPVHSSLLPITSSTDI